MEPVKNPDRLSPATHHLIEAQEGALGKMSFPSTKSFHHPFYLKRLEEIESYLTPQNPGQFKVDRYGDQYRKLATDKPTLRSFLAELEQYEQRWNQPTPRLTEAACSHNRHPSLMYYLKNHFASQGTYDIFGFPSAVLIDALNRSPLGRYVSSTPAVTNLEQFGRSDFTTLCHLPFWRNVIATNSLKVIEQHFSQRESLDLIVLGDGSGDLGATVSEKLARAGKFQRLIHIDISPAMLQQQRVRYLAAGRKEHEIISVEGDLMSCKALLKSRVPDLKHAVFVLHEIFDDLRTHAVWSDSVGTGEMLTTVERNGEKLGTMGFSSDDALISNLPRYLPMYANSSLRPVIRGFCPEAMILLREMLTSIESGAIITADYGGEFIAETAKTSPQALPYRVYGPDIEDVQNYHLGFKHPCSITADVNPSLLHFSEAFGGKVQFLGSAVDFISEVNPNFPYLIPEIMSDARKVFSGELTVPPNVFIELKVALPLFCPSMFAGVIVKR